MSQENVTFWYQCMMGITSQKTMLLVDEEMIEVSGMAADNFKKLLRSLCTWVIAAW